MCMDGLHRLAQEKRERATLVFTEGEPAKKKRASKVTFLPTAFLFLSSQGDLNLVLISNFIPSSLPFSSAVVATPSDDAHSPLAAPNAFTFESVCLLLLFLY